ncbi:GNAT family N-acetyltransferase, partial [Alphaproteobacteria bacterium]|nr:GNAT family N-acetyltransferase [Alphaproteobacteria bacterium]
MKKSTKIRSFKNNDIEKILEIYNYHIENGYSNFEEKKVSKKYFNNLCKKIINNKLPFLIYEKNNIVVGFTYLTNFRNKSGYKFSFENSIYIHNDFKGKGIGQKLLKK